MFHPLREYRCTFLERIAVAAQCFSKACMADPAIPDDEALVAGAREGDEGRLRNSCAAINGGSWPPLPVRQG